MEKAAEDDFGSRVVGSVIVAADDHVGDGLSGHENAVVFPVAIDELAFYILTKTGKVIIQKSVWALSEATDTILGYFIKLQTCLDASIRENQEGCSYSVLREIVDHHSNGHAHKKDDGYEVGSDGQRRPKHTMKG
jgi:hypothetical protein